VVGAGCGLFIAAFGFVASLGGGASAAEADGSEITVWIFVIVGWAAFLVFAVVVARLVARAWASPAGVQAPQSGQAPRWCADPSGRHEYRYWDGVRWTEHVADGGVATTDHQA
jgi:hypothetical protein